jgi:hypothetical protein
MILWLFMYILDSWWIKHIWLYCLCDIHYLHDHLIYANILKSYCLITSCNLYEYMTCRPSYWGQIFQVSALSKFPFLKLNFPRNFQQYLLLWVWIWEMYMVIWQQNFTSREMDLIELKVSNIIYSSANSPRF